MEDGRERQQECNGYGNLAANMLVAWVVGGRRGSESATDSRGATPDVDFIEQMLVEAQQEVQDLVLATRFCRTLATAAARRAFLRDLCQFLPSACSAGEHSDHAQPDHLYTGPTDEGTAGMDLPPHQQPSTRATTQTRPGSASEGAQSTGAHTSAVHTGVVRSGVQTSGGRPRGGGANSPRDLDRPGPHDRPSLMNQGRANSPLDRPGLMNQGRASSPLDRPGLMNEGHAAAASPQGRAAAASPNGNQGGAAAASPKGKRSAVSFTPGLERTGALPGRGGIGTSDSDQSPAAARRHNYFVHNLEQELESPNKFPPSGGRGQYLGPTASGLQAPRGSRLALHDHDPADDDDDDDLMLPPHIEVALHSGRGGRGRVGGLAAAAAAHGGVEGLAGGGGRLAAKAAAHGHTPTLSGSAEGRQVLGSPARSALNERASQFGPREGRSVWASPGRPALHAPSPIHDYISKVCHWVKWTASLCR